MKLSEQVGPLRPDDSAPLYRQLQRSLRDAISRAILSPEDALPPERDLAEDFRVSRITVRKALDALTREGLLDRRQGAGTFVTSRVEKSFSKLSSFSEDMLSRGRTPRSRWIARTSGTVTPDEAMTLSLSPGTAVERLHRVRYADDVPMAVEYSTVPAFALGASDAVEASLYAALERTGHRPVRALQRLRAVLVAPEQAEHLGVATGEAGLLIERHGFLRDGRTVEVTKSFYRGDAYDFVAELHAVS